MFAHAPSDGSAVAYATVHWDALARERSLFALKGPLLNGRTVSNVRDMSDPHWCGGRFDAETVWRRCAHRRLAVGSGDRVPGVAGTDARRLAVRPFRAG